jgi:hypothetical protein
MVKQKIQFYDLDNFLELAADAYIEGLKKEIAKLNLKRVENGK